MDKKLPNSRKFNKQTYPTVQTVTDNKIKHRHTYLPFLSVNNR